MPNYQSDYKVVVKSTVKELNEEVTKAVQNGYEPIGGMNFYADEKKNESGELEKSFKFFQTVYKR